MGKRLMYIKKVLKKINAFLKLKLNKINSVNFYDIYWRENKKSVHSWSYGINIIENLTSNYEFRSILDAGCGAGDVVRHLISKGYQAKGIEISKSVLEDYARDLLKKGIVKNGSLLNLPYPDNSFDVVFSSEVLEHIPECDIPNVVSELYRVSKDILFLTISLRPSSNNNKYHITLKPRSWWENHFNTLPLVKDELMVNKLQKKDKNASFLEIMEAGPTKNILTEIEWFTNNPPFDLEGEFEPWYFIFKKLK